MRARSSVDRSGVTDAEEQVGSHDARLSPSFQDVDRRDELAEELKHLPVEVGFDVLIDVTPEVLL
jgi:hypothetical protein